MALGAICALAVWPVALLVPMPRADLESDLASRLLIAGSAALGPLLSLVAGIGFIARHRFFTPAAIDGASPPGDRVLAAANAYLQNTIEQIALAIPVYAMLSLLLPARLLGAVPLLGLAFLIGRIAFARGYSKGASARAFGFALTFYASVLGLLVAIALMALRVIA